MLQLTSLWTRPFVFLAAVLVGGWCCGTAQAQLDPDLNSETALNSAFTKAAKDTKKSVKDSFYEMSTGRKEATTKEDERALDIAAKYFIYPVALPQNQPPQASFKKMEDLVSHFDNLITGITRTQVKEKDTVKKFVEIFSKKLAKSFKDVFGLSQAEPNNRYARLNAARMLPAYARLKQEDAADFMVGLLKDIQPNDPVQQYVLKGIKEFYTLREITSDDPPEKLQNDAKRIQGLLDYMEKMAKRSPSDKKLENDAVNYIRREAIRALSATRVPGFVIKKGDKLQAPVAYQLTTVLAGWNPKEGVKGDPNQKVILPSLGEQLEAAIGLCKLQSKFIPGYRNEVGVYLMGRFLERYAEEYGRDRENFAGKLKDKDSKEPKKLPKQPWKAQATALSAALKDLEKNQGDNPKIKELIKDFSERARTVLSAIEGSRSIELTALNPLNSAVKELKKELRPAGDAEVPIYQDAKELTIRLPD
jgi:hypothetical protein